MKEAPITLVKSQKKIDQQPTYIVQVISKKQERLSFISPKSSKWQQNGSTTAKIKNKCQCSLAWTRNTMQKQRNKECRGKKTRCIITNKTNYWTVFSRRDNPKSGLAAEHGYVSPKNGQIRCKTYIWSCWSQSLFNEQLWSRIHCRL